MQRQPQQLARRRVGLADQAAIVDHDNAAGQQVQQVLQAIGQPLVFCQLSDAPLPGQRQLAFKLGNPGFQQAVGVGQLSRHLIEQRERLLKLRRVGGHVAQRRGSPCEIRDRGLLGGVGHGTFSLG